MFLQLFCISFMLWEKTEAPGENPHQQEGSMQTTDRKNCPEYDSNPGHTSYQQAYAKLPHNFN